MAKNLVVISNGPVGLHMAWALKKSIPDANVHLCNIQDNTNSGIPIVEVFYVPRIENCSGLENKIRDSFQFYNDVYQNPNEKSIPEIHGLYPIPIYNISPDPGVLHPPYSIRSSIKSGGFTDCDQRELNLFQPDDHWKSGSRHRTYMVTNKLFNQWMKDEIIGNGVTVHELPNAKALKATIDNLSK